ncbi:MAG: nitronate monooxygenase [Alphaproteobacteria bacterium]|nr:nitronate monooxygenase [Alphaproteobacteria bacterium]
MPDLSTPLSRRLGLRHPIVAAPMFLVSNREMIVACAEAGILGSMPSLNARTAEAFEADLQWIRARTDRPFGINVTLGLTAPERTEADLTLLERYEVPVWLTSYGNPTAAVARAHAAKALVFHDVVNKRHALKAAGAGVDGLIGVAAGAGGHAGAVSPYVLYPWLAQHVDVPLLAAGCISTGKQILASFALGAQLAYVGTRFLASTECGAVPAYKQAVVDADPEDVVYTAAVSGIPANFLRATIPDDMTPDRTPEGARRWKDIWSAGQGVAEIHEVKPIGQIVEDLVREVHDALAALPGR